MSYVKHFEDQNRNSRDEFKESSSLLKAINWFTSQISVVFGRQLVINQAPWTVAGPKPEVLWDREL